MIEVSNLILLPVNVFLGSEISENFKALRIIGLGRIVVYKVRILHRLLISDPTTQRIY